MAGNELGTFFRVTTWGESHGPALGCVVDGCPAGLELSEAVIRAELAKRRPGAARTDGAPRVDSPRAEPDEPRILSGVFEGMTTGAPVCVEIASVDARSSDHDPHRALYRPGHGDRGWDARFGHRDHRGGGRLSGRETAARVAAGAIAKRLLAASGIEILAWTSRAAGIACERFDEAEIERNAMRAPDAKAAALMLARIAELAERGDTAGGIVACRATGLPEGLGSPVFEGLDASLARAMVSIPGARGFELGDGFACADLTGSEFVDELLPPAPGGSAPRYASNRSGGTLGGLSTGAALEFRVAFKPVASQAIEAATVDASLRAATWKGSGRNDRCLCPRAAPVVEAMAAIVIADALLALRAARV